MFPKQITHSEMTVQGPKGYPKKVKGDFMGSNFAPLIDFVWRQKNRPTMDQMRNKLDDLGFSKEAYTHFKGTIMAIGK